MKITLVLRDTKNALRLSNKTIESFIECIKTDIKDRVVARRRKQFCINEAKGKWISALAIVAAFGRMLSGISGLKKRETKRNTEYLVRCLKL